VLESGCAAIILRVPILYGPVDRLGESSVDTILKVLQDAKPDAKMNDIERRFPTHVDDVANVLLTLSRRWMENPEMCGTYHWSGDEEFTKFEMMGVLASAFGLSTAHVRRSTPEEEAAAGAATRPYNAHLATDKLRTTFGCRNRYTFRDGVYDALKEHVDVVASKETA